MKESFSPCTPFQRTELRGFIKCKINSRPCHPERSAAKSNCEAAPSKARWDLGRNTLKSPYRSRFAPSLGSGSTAKISHREIFSAQDDIRYVNIAGRGELRSPAGDRRSPLQNRMLIVKNIKCVCFFRVVEGADPYRFVRM